MDKQESQIIAAGIGLVIVIMTCFYFTTPEGKNSFFGKLVSGKIPPIKEAVYQKNSPQPITQNIRSSGSVGQQLKDFVFKDKSGATHSLLGLVQGQKTLLYAYAPGCGHCKKQLPLFAEKIKTLEKDINILGLIYYGGPEFDLIDHMDHDIPGVAIVDKGGAICGQFGISEFTIITTDKNGNIRYRGAVEPFEEVQRSLND